MLCLKIAGWMANSADPDETVLQHLVWVYTAQACISENMVNMVTVIYLQFYTYASQDLLGLYKVSPTRKSLRPLQNFPL